MRPLREGGVLRSKDHTHCVVNKADTARTNISLHSSPPHEGRDLRLTDAERWLQTQRKYQAKGVSFLATLTKLLGILESIIIRRKYGSIDTTKVLIRIPPSRGTFSRSIVSDSS